MGCLGAIALAGQARADQLFDQQAGALSTPVCSGDPGCNTNYNVIVDLDGDGALDLVFPNSTGFFTSTGTAEPFVVYKGTKTGTFTDVSATAVAGFKGAVREVAIGDVDGDGDLDMYAPEAHGGADKFFINQGGMVFADEAATRIDVHNTDAGATRFGDFDDDGDLDLFVGLGFATSSMSAGRVYKNDGTGKFALDATALPNVSVFQVDDVDLADIDGDFDLDIVVNVHQSNFVVFKNDGTGKFTNASSNLPPHKGGLHYGPGVCDVDGDGDLDIIVDNAEGGNKEQLMINNGDGTYTDKSSQIIDDPGDDDNGANCADVDGDGDLDLIIPSLQSPGERVYENDGHGTFTEIASAFPGIGDPTLWMDFGDLDGDGRLDAVTAQGEGVPKDEQVYFGNANVAIDTRAPKIIAQSATMTSAAEQIVRFRISDNAVTDVGPRLQRAWLKVGLNEIDAKFVGGDVFRAVIPAGAAGTPIVACATDRQGNTNAECGGENPASTSSSASTGASMTTTGASMSTGSTTGSTSSGSGGGGGNGAGDSGGGCGCVVASTDETRELFGLAIAVSGAAIVVARRRSRNHAGSAK
ncbi:MAG: VCBS repeat-containing protein [Polyangiaceae bacterium]